MHPIYCVCLLLSVGFQHCLTFAYSKVVYRHCLVAITPKENRINAVFLSLICRECQTLSFITVPTAAVFLTSAKLSCCSFVCYCGEFPRQLILKLTSDVQD